MEPKTLNIAKRLQGLQTAESIQRILGVRKGTAIKIVHNLRKAGLVKTSGGGRQPRFYRISATKEVVVGGRGLYETINKYSKIKIVEPYKHRVAAKDMSVEEAIARAAASGEFRTALASLGLFNHIKNWAKLYSYSKKLDARREVGALYDVARKIVKTRRMDNRIRIKLKEGKAKRFIIKDIKSKDFLEIEKEWGISIPFNKSDLWRYKE